MAASIAFMFPFNATYADVRAAVDAHFKQAGQTVDRTPSGAAATLTATHTALPAGASEPAAPSVDGDGFPWDERIHSSSKGITEKGVWRLRKGVSPTEVTKVKAELLHAMGKGAPATKSAPEASEAQRAIRLQYANDEALRICGPNPVDPFAFEKLLRGQLIEVPQAHYDYYTRFLAARNEAFGNYVEGAVSGHTEQSAGPLDPETLLDPAKMFGGQQQPVTTVTSKPTTTGTLDPETFAGVTVLLAKAKAAGLITPDEITETLGQLGLTSMAELAKDPSMVPPFRQILQAIYDI